MQKGPTKRDMYFPALDGIRALAVLLVVFHHLGPFPAANDAAELLNRFTSWGWIGVDCFFVLSGFLITRLLLEEKAQIGNISLPKFYLRRAARIWPLYYLMLFLASVVVPFCSPHQPSFMEWIGAVPRIIAPFMLFAGNFSIIFDWKSLYEFDKAISGIGASMMCAMLMPLWSISIEEQFYLAWPWIVNKAKSLGILSKTSVAFAASSILASTAILWSLPTSSIELLHNFYYLNTACRIFPLMAGALLAILHFANPPVFANSGKQPLKLASLSAVLFFLVLAYMPPIQKVSLLHIVTFAATAGAFSLLIWLSLAWKPLTSVFSNKVLVYLGKRSYAIYLFHVPCMWLVRTGICPLFHIQFLSATEWVVTAVVGIPLSILASELSWHLIEKPFIGLRQTLNPLNTEKGAKRAEHNTLSAQHSGIVGHGR
ncbi:MAG: acyltransferase [Candidatus Obscuribacterales bacterium]|nr:acyltransferase [Candidatus Obscuribacterales bacterium]